MTSPSSTTPPVWVAIDVAKASHQVLIEGPSGQRRSMRVGNTTPDLNRLVTYLRDLQRPCTIAFEPTGDYHRAVMHLLGRAGFQLRQVSSLAVARTRDALFNSWEDAIECAKCGGRMVRTGSCYTCRDCGQNTGCS